MPGAFGDAFRAIEALPGVTPIVSGLPFFFVRGAPPGNVGYFLDGVRVPLLYHLALGPSVVHPGLIDHVDFFPGGYPARYGRFAGGILDGETLPPASRTHGEANVRLFDAGVLAEAPLLDDRLTVLVAGRYSYTAALVQLFAPNTRVGYWDYQTRVEYRLTPKDRVSVFWFGSYDEIDNRDQDDADRRPSDTSRARPSAPSIPVFKTEFHRLDLRYDHDTPHGHVRLAVTLGVEDSIAGSSATQQTGVAAKSIGVRAEGEERLSPDLKLRYGADTFLYDYTIDTGTDPAADLRALYPHAQRRDDRRLWRRRLEGEPARRDRPRTAHRHLHVAARAGGHPGGTERAGHHRPAPRPRWLPSRAWRRARRCRATVTWISTFGVAHQPPSLFVPIPGLTLGTLSTGLQTALQTSQGAEIELPLDFKLTSTVFLHDYLGLTDATATCLGNGTSVPNASNDCLAQKVNGRAYGVELLARRDLTKRVTGLGLLHALAVDARDARHRLHRPRARRSARLHRAARCRRSPPSSTGRTCSTSSARSTSGADGGRELARCSTRGRPYSPTVQGVPVAALQLRATADLLPPRRPPRETLARLRQRLRRVRRRGDERDAQQGGHRGAVQERRHALPAEVRHVHPRVHRSGLGAEHRRRGGALRGAGDDGACHFVAAIALGSLFPLPGWLRAGCGPRGRARIAAGIRMERAMLEIAVDVLREASSGLGVRHGCGCHDERRTRAERDGRPGR